MTNKELVKYIVDREGKKSKVSVGDIREIVGILSDLVFETYPDGDALIKIINCLFQQGKRRAKKKKKKK